MPSRPEPGPPAWPKRLLDGLDDADRRAGDVARGLGEAQLNWRPAPHLWSVGQCLHHLLRANEVYLAPIAGALDRDKAPTPAEEITPGWFGRWFIRTSIEPSPKSRRGRAPGKIKPVPEVGPDILARFLASNEFARTIVRRASAHDVNRIRFQNPFVPVIFFTVGTGLEIIVRHERRHLLQAERIRRTPTFPG